MFKSANLGVAVITIFTLIPSHSARVSGHLAAGGTRCGAQDRSYDIQVSRSSAHHGRPQHLFMILCPCLEISVRLIMDIWDAAADARGPHLSIAKYEWQVVVSSAGPWLCLYGQSFFCLYQWAWQHYVTQLWSEVNEQAHCLQRRTETVPDVISTSACQYDCA